MNFLGDEFIVRRRGCGGPARRFYKGESSQSSSQATTSQVNDSRVGVADDGAYASGGGSVDKSSNDNRTFDDHSTFSVQTTDSHADQSTNVDSRDFSDHSMFSIADSGNTTTNTTTTDSRDMSNRSTTTNTDSRNLSDNSTFSIANSGNTTTTNTDSSTTTTNITTSDPGTLKELAAGAFSAANLSTLKGSEMLSSVLAYGDTLSKTAAAGVAADRAFAGEVTSKVIEATKSADQQNTEKLVKAGTYVAVAAAVAFTASRIFGKAKK